MLIWSLFHIEIVNSFTHNTSVKGLVKLAKIVAVA